MALPGSGAQVYNQHAMTTKRHLGASLFQVGGLLLFLLAAAPPSAHAYLDPGTGSMVVQALLAALVGAGLMIRGLRARLVALVRRLLRPGAQG